MKVINGNLLELGKAGQFDVIVHGCNCFCTMGSGIALSIKLEFPDAFEADKNTESGMRSKLGTYSCAELELNDHRLTIVNAYTQFDYKRDKVNADYDAIRLVMNCIKKDFKGKRIGYPLIGAGLAGGDWLTIEEIIKEELAGEDHTLVKYAS